MEKTGLYITWAIRIIVCVVIVLASLGKFDPEGNMAVNFTKWGYGIYLMYIAGLLEGFGGIFLLFNKTLRIGIASVTLVMLVAMVTHIRFYDELGFPILNIGIIAGLALVGYYQYKYAGSKEDAETD